jgi:hypothetical protein
LLEQAGSAVLAASGVTAFGMLNLGAAGRASERDNSSGDTDAANLDSVTAAVQPLCSWSLISGRLAISVASSGSHS